MERTIAERVQHARRTRFVGRQAELEAFRQMLAEPGVLFVHGPGGVGKTALVHRFAEVAAEAGRRVTRLDARTVEPSPPRLRAAVPNITAEHVLMIDTYELLAGLDDWFREVFLPELPAGVAVVIAGRDPPAPAWLADPGWRALLRVVALRNLRPDQTFAYLHAEGVPPTWHERVHRVTHGHPLALSLVAELLGRHRCGPDDLDLAGSPDVVRVLLERFVAQVPSARHRFVLEICAHARFTTADLLRAALPGDGDETEELFGWLRRRSFVEEGTRGVFPHDLARDVLETDLRWRDPTGYVDLHRRVRAYVIDRIGTRAGPRSWADGEQQQNVTDLLFLHRTNPVLGAFVDFGSLGQAYAEPPRPGDRAAIVAMTRRHEGAGSAALAGYWLDRRPEWVAVFRGREAEPIGFAVLLLVDQLTAAERAVDPGAAAAWDYTRRCGIRPGEPAVATRFFLDRDAYQGQSRSFNLMAMLSIQMILGCPGLAMSMELGLADVPQKAPLFLSLGYHRADEAGYSVDGRWYGGFANDFRRRPVTDWLAGMADFELGGPPPAPPAPPVLVLAQPDFANAARQALRSLHRPDALAGNPLLRSRVVRDRVGDEAAPADLAGLIRDTAALLRDDARDGKLFRALDRTYLRPAATQEKAAEVLGLPFSTYRRHLTRGVERLVELLWHRELHGPN